MIDSKKRLLRIMVVQITTQPLYTHISELLLEKGLPIMNSQVKLNLTHESHSFSERQQKILNAIMNAEDHAMFLGLLNVRIREPLDELIDDLTALEQLGLISIDPPSFLTKESPDLLCRFRITGKLSQQ
jgi:hypothetical protein